MSGVGSGVMGHLDDLVARLPGNTAGLGVGVLTATVVFLLLPLGIVMPGFGFILVDQAVLFVLYAMVLLGLNLQFGDTGIINFGPVLFLGLGLYGMAFVSAAPPEFSEAVGLNMFWGLGILVGIVLAVVGGVVLGVSSLRLREDYLAITTLAAAEILFEFVRVFQNPFGGSKGILGVPQLVVESGSGPGVLPFAENAATRDLATLLLLVGVLLIAYEAFERLSSSPYGRVLRSIQADEDASRGLGKRTFRYKIQAFIYGAIVAGVAGGLMAMYFGSVSPGLITIDVTVIIWIGMMIGGSGNHRGAITGLAIVMFFELGVRLLNAPVTQGLDLMTAKRFNALRGLLIGVLLILVIRYRPEGLFGDEEQLEVFK
jgi:branched-chain amino acid transport system permease protein